MKELKTSHLDVVNYLNIIDIHKLKSQQCK